MAESTSSEPIRVLIVDDRPSDCETWPAHLLCSYPDIKIVGGATDGTAALAMVTDLSLDVMRMDIQMAGVNGIEIARRIH